MHVTATLIVERDDEEIELTIEGDYSPGVPGKSLAPSGDFPDDPEDIELEEIFFDGESWDGQLTDEERGKALKALIEEGKSYEPDDVDYEEEDQPLSPLDFDDD